MVISVYPRLLSMIFQYFPGNSNLLFEWQWYSPRLTGGLPAFGLQTNRIWMEGVHYYVVDRKLEGTKPIVFHYIKLCGVLFKTRPNNSPRKCWFTTGRWSRTKHRPSRPCICSDWASAHDAKMLWNFVRFGFRLVTMTA